MLVWSYLYVMDKEICLNMFLLDMSIFIKVVCFMIFWMIVIVCNVFDIFVVFIM